MRMVLTILAAIQTIALVLFVLALVGSGGATVHAVAAAVSLVGISVCAGALKE